MRIIAHIDLDAFFAAVEVLRNPRYRGKPLIVGGDPTKRRGVVATCSYEARAFGVRSAMPLQEARRLCPHAIFLPPDMKTYSQYSRLFHETLFEFSPVVEPVSVDEAFIDMTGCEHFYASLKDMASRIQKRIFQRSSLPATVGIGPNKFLAKLASDSGKPHGTVIVTPEQAQTFLDPLPVQRLWGVGPKTAKRLNDMGIASVRDLRKQPLDVLTQHMGPSTARHLHALAHGLDNRPVEPPGAAKSISRETTFEWDIRDETVIKQTLARLVADVGFRLRMAGQWAGNVTLKVRFPDFTTVTRQRALPSPVQNDDRIFDAAWALWSSLNTRRPVRLLGVGVGELTSMNQGALFNDDSKSDLISETMDKVNQKLGSRTLLRGREWGKA